MGVGKSKNVSSHLVLVTIFLYYANMKNGLTCLRTICVVESVIYASVGISHDLKMLVLQSNQSPQSCDTSYFCYACRTHFIY